MYLKGLRFWKFIFSEIDFILNPPQGRSQARTRPEPRLRQKVCVPWKQMLDALDPDSAGCARTACQAGPGSGGHHVGPLAVWVLPPAEKVTQSLGPAQPHRGCPPASEETGTWGAARPGRGWTPRNKGSMGRRPWGVKPRRGQGLHGWDKSPKADGVNWGTACNSSLCRVVSPRGGLLPTPPPTCQLRGLSGSHPTLRALPAPRSQRGRAWPHRCPKSRRVLRTHNVAYGLREEWAFCCNRCAFCF